MGRYLLPAGAMSRLRSEKPTVQGEIQLTGVLDAAARDGSLAALDVSDRRYYDLGTMEGFREANARLAMEEPGP